MKKKKDGKSGTKLRGTPIRSSKGCIPLQRQGRQHRQQHEMWACHRHSSLHRPNPPTDRWWVTNVRWSSAYSIRWLRAPLVHFFLILSPLLLLCLPSKPASRLILANPRGGCLVSRSCKGRGISLFGRSFWSFHVCVASKYTYCARGNRVQSF